MYDPTKPYIKELLELVKQTWETPYISVRDGLIVERKFSYPEYPHTDGIGTKGVYHWKQRSFKNAVIDAMNMNRNDLAFNRAIPYQITDHLFLPEDDHTAILDIIRYLTEECKKGDIAITAGETSIHNNMEGLEISITMLGFVKEPKPNRFRAGDKLIGIESNGLHSNGFTEVRDKFGEEYRPEFILPTYNYLDTILALNEKLDIHGMKHITGGAFTKLKDVLPDDADALINNKHRLYPRDIFFELHERGISSEEMYKTFNCGIGFVLGVSKEDSGRCLDKIKDFPADIIGDVKQGSGRVLIESQFDNRIIPF